MNILRHSDYNKRFECHCGCIFEAAQKEYKWRKDPENYGTLIFWTYCPECGSECNIKEKND